MLKPCAIGAAMLLASLSAGAVDPASPDYRAGYEAGYRAAMEAAKAAATATPAAQPASAPAQAAAPAEVAAAPAKPSGPPDWWNHSAHLYEQLVPTWRHHVELQFTGASLSGNDTGFAVRGGLKLYSRRNDWTNELLANIDHRHIVQEGGAVNQRDYRILQESLRHDLTEHLYAAGGFILQRDDVNFIDERTTVLAGLGYYLVDTQKLRLNVFLAPGELRETYMPPVPQLVGIDGRRTGIVYLYETIDYQLAPEWSVQQGFRVIQDLHTSGRFAPDPTRPGLYFASEMVRRYRTIGSLGLTYQLSPASSVSLVVESRFDSNPWPGVRPRDTTRRVTLNLLH